MKKITINKEEFNCRVRRSKVAKNMRLSVGSSGILHITVPRFLPIVLVKKFVLENADWVLRHIRKVQSREVLKVRKYIEAKEESRKFIESRLNYYATEYGFKFNRVSIRNQKSRWGSCSAKRNLNFNYRLLFLPIHLADYVIVHELCHLKEMNHSREFWKLVGGILPDYRERRRDLKKISF